MLQGVGLRVERTGSFASSSFWVGNPRPVYKKRGSHGARTVVVAAATKVKPKIMRLRKDEIAEVLPWSGSGEQRLQKLGTPSTWLARLAISLAGSVMLYNYNTMAAAMASLYWAWDPVLSTAFANTSLRLQYPYAGLWKARVLSAKVVKPARRPRSNDVLQEIFDASPAPQPFLQLVIGDGSSATLEMKVGVPSKRYQVQVGEAVEVLVLSDTKSLSRFMAVRDIYLPDMALWLSENPCIERPVFEDLIENLRAGTSSPVSPSLKSRDVPSMKARLSESVDMIPERGLDQRRFGKDTDSAEPQTGRRWRLTQLDYEEFEGGFDDDPKLQALRRLGQKQNIGELQRRVQVQADAYGPPMQYERMEEYDSELEDRQEQDNSNVLSDEDNAQVPETNDSRQDVQVTTVDELLGIGLNELPSTRVSEGELVQEEEF